MTSYIVTDLGFGDAGKGTVVDFLARHRPDSLVVRHNGGAQAGHNVMTPDGKHHCFAQWGSGTLHGCHTYLSKYMVFNPLSMVTEAEHLEQKMGLSNALARLYISPRALMTTPYNVGFNRYQEMMRGRDVHGSCGLGVGETRRFFLEVDSDPPMGDDFVRPASLRQKLRQQRIYYKGYCSAHGWNFFPELEDDDLIDMFVDVCMVLSDAITLVTDDAMNDGSKFPVIFEGAQGVLLDEWWGTFPHNSWTNTTIANAIELNDNTRPLVSLGVIRSYMTRHGQGPFPTEGMQDGFQFLSEPHNLDHGFQGRFRVGCLDLVLLRYAMQVAGPIDALAVTHMDRLPVEVPICVRYEQFEDIDLGGERDLTYRRQMTNDLFNATPVITTVPRDEFLDFLETELHTPVLIESYGPSFEQKKMRW